MSGDIKIAQRLSLEEPRRCPTLKSSVVDFGKNCTCREETQLVEFCRNWSSNPKHP
jgi:hypothetical protein